MQNRKKKLTKVKTNLKRFRLQMKSQKFIKFWTNNESDQCGLFIWQLNLIYELLKNYKGKKVYSLSKSFEDCGDNWRRINRSTWRPSKFRGYILLNLDILAVKVKFLVCGYIFAATTATCRNLEITRLELHKWMITLKKHQISILPIIYDQPIDQ